MLNIIYEPSISDAFLKGVIFKLQFKKKIEIIPLQEG